MITYHVGLIMVYAPILHYLTIQLDFPQNNECIFRAAGPLLDLRTHILDYASELEDPPLAFLWNPGLLLGAVWTVAMWTSGHWRYSRS